MFVSGKFFVNSHCLLEEREYSLGENRERNGWESSRNMAKDTAAENILDLLSDLKNYPHKPLAPYEEFEVDGQTYYFTPGGILYRKDPTIVEVGGFFLGYLPDELWRYRTDDS